MIGDTVRILEDEMHEAVAIDVSVDAWGVDPSSWSISIEQGADRIVFPFVVVERFALELLAAAVYAQGSAEGDTSDQLAQVKDALAKVKATRREKGES